ncbi:unnamed protein product [Plutella xylostella]|uniref:(diamondback moth) hypothetical protein n=1 Tax=Plutella xylostella TaxID=51655 RepID=A0A8S4ELP8_PLUXY|nr:unnamed protein product [Plutella xylostella]
MESISSWYRDLLDNRSEQNILLQLVCATRPRPNEVMSTSS